MKDSSMSNLFKHIKTVATHRKWVRHYCFKVGLIWQGLVHDLSKYSPTELSICKYYTGKKSPHQTCREVLGYSPSWNHHYHVNKHHFQYWWDEDEKGAIIPVKMPFNYVLESVCDMLGASKAYNPKGWKPQMLLDYWNTKCKGQRLMHKESEAFVENMILKIVELGENDFFKWFKVNKKEIKSNY